MPPRKKQKTASEQEIENNEIFTIDSPWTPSGKTIRDLMTKDTDLMKNLDKQWDDFYKKRRETITNTTISSKELRNRFRIIDIDSFGYHKWFQDLFDNAITSHRVRTLQTLELAIGKYTKRLESHVFPKTASQIETMLSGIGHITDFCEKVRNGHYGLIDDEVIVSYLEWYFKNKFESKQKNIYFAHYEHIKKYTSFWQSIMEIQGWFVDKETDPRPNAMKGLSKEPHLKEYKRKMKQLSKKKGLELNKTIVESRLVTKVLDRGIEKKFINVFNKIKPETKTLQDMRSTLRAYTILSFNYNLGYRSKGARNICYSWMMYKEIKFVAGGIYLNIGNPSGFKWNKVNPFRFAQFIVRHIYPEQCPIGSLIKTLVAEHDILRPTFKVTTVLDEIEHAIDECADGIVRKSDPKWETYRIFHRDHDTHKPIHHSTYAGKIKWMYEHIGADDLVAITHEPHNRVGNRMQELHLDTREISLYMGWATEKMTQLDTLYSLQLDTKGATARSGHRGCTIVPPIYDCPRDGLNDDFADFQDIRALVLQNRPAELLEKAKAVPTKFQKRLRAAVLFLELLDKFLIRVWLEDAAILQPKFQKSICYDGHPVFAHPRWGELKNHLRQLRNIRSSPNDREKTPDHSPLKEAPQQRASSSMQPLYDIMKQVHHNITIASLYHWRKQVDAQWDVLKEPGWNRGISKDYWTHASGNRNLYNHPVRLYRYIDKVVKGPPHKDLHDVLHRLQRIADSFSEFYENALYTGNKTRDFAETQFHYLSEGEPAINRNQNKKLIPLDEFYAAFTTHGLPLPTPAFVGMS